MGIFRYDSKYSTPAKEQRERYMKGGYEELPFGNDTEILLVLQEEAAYLKDDRKGRRILFTGIQDKRKVHDEIRRILKEHEAQEKRPDEFHRCGTE